MQLGIEKQILKAVSVIVFCALVTLFSTSVSLMAGETAIDCDIQTGGCQKEFMGRTVSLEILPRPVRAMRNLTFRVKVSGNPIPAPPSIDLGMHAMHMGKNHVVMKKFDNQLYEGQGVIVRCKSGNTIWWAKVNLPEMGSVMYTFDVIY